MIAVRQVLVWVLLLLAAVVAPIGAAAMSPLLAWREPIYIVAGFAGVIAMVLMVFQPLLAVAILPGVSARRARLVHRSVGALLVVFILLHVVGLWITSPPDVVDALLFVSPTPFSAWGVIAMWALFVSALLVLFRQKLPLRVRSWRISHRMLAIVIVIGSIVHALLIDGTMEFISKSILCALLIIATLSALLKVGLSGS